MNTESITIKASPSEKKELTRAWKAAEDVTSCSQYIREAVNAYSGKTIFEEAKE